jgi:hypothetical protein
MCGGIPFVGSLDTKIDRNLFGSAHVNVSWRQHSYVIHKACTHDHAETCNDPDRLTLLHSGDNHFESPQGFQLHCLGFVVPLLISSPRVTQCWHLITKKGSFRIHCRWKCLMNLPSQSCNYNFLSCRNTFKDSTKSLHVTVNYFFGLNYISWQKRKRFSSYRAENTVCFYDV